MNAFWIILTGVLVASCCGLLGCYLVLRKSAMIGDAISHAVLPGIFLAYLFAGSQASIPMLIGAASFGLLCTFLIEFVSKQGNLQMDAAIGLVFTFLFAVGVILVTAFSSDVHLDQDCVLYGEIAYVPLDIWYTDSGLNLGPISVWMMGGVLILVLALVFLGYKALFVTTFDPVFADASGISTTFWHYLLMGAVSLTTVMAFKFVGAILVVAFLIVPAATAYLLTNNLKVMLLLSVLLGSIACGLGYFLAVGLDGSIAGAIATVMGIMFGLVFLVKQQRVIA